jgi:hypothetical protein
MFRRLGEPLMTESQWLSSNRPGELLTFLHLGGNRRDRIPAWIEGSWFADKLVQKDRFLDKRKAQLLYDAILDAFGASHVRDALESLFLAAGMPEMRDELEDMSAEEVVGLLNHLDYRLPRGVQPAGPRPGTEDWWRGTATKRCEFIRDIFGNPFRPVKVDSRWRSSAAVALARTIDAEKAYNRLPILADMLEEASCNETELLNHCRQPGIHVRGCWVVDLLLEDAKAWDLILGKE